MTSRSPDIAWDVVGSVGGFFALRTGEPPERTLPMIARVYEIGRAVTEGDPLSFRVTKVAARLAAPEPRVAASIAHLGLAARLWSLALGPAALYGRVPDLDPRLLRWDADGSSPDDLWLSGDGTFPADAARIRDVVLDGHLAPLADALRARYRNSPALLRGNAGSALRGGARAHDTRGGRRGPPPPGGRR
ncbi:ferric iron reductase, partial [Streptomyces spectabilis]|uniref:ferric iron reductase n=1 Tax=Streptomyces spectabilis TaxID=68270 RepID=UPI0033ED1DCE